MSGTIPHLILIDTEDGEAVLINPHKIDSIVLNKDGNGNLFSVSEIKTRRGGYEVDITFDDLKKKLQQAGVVIL